MKSKISAGMLCCRRSARTAFVAWVLPLPVSPVTKMCGSGVVPASWIEPDITRLAVGASRSTQESPHSLSMVFDGFLLQPGLLICLGWESGCASCSTGSGTVSAGTGSTTGGVVFLSSAGDSSSSGRSSAAFCTKASSRLWLSCVIYTCTDVSSSSRAIAPRLCRLASSTPQAHIHKSAAQIHPNGPVQETLQAFAQRCRSSSGRSLSPVPDTDARAEPLVGRCCNQFVVTLGRQIWASRRRVASICPTAGPSDIPSVTVYSPLEIAPLWPQ